MFFLGIMSNRMLSKVFRSKILVWLGKYSFGIYALQWPIIISISCGYCLFLIKKGINYNLAGWSGILLGVIITIVLSVFVQKKIYTPAYKLLLTIWNNVQKKVNCIRKSNIMDFSTVFFECSNIELVKDVAQIPSTLARMYGMKAELVSSYVKENGPNSSVVDGLQLRHFPMIKNGKITGVFFLLRYARYIKWLNIYHIDKKSYYWSRLYKLLNPAGHIYLKMDVDFRMCEDFEQNLNRRSVLQKCAKVVDLISAESESGLSRVQPFVKKKIDLIPNGYCISDKETLNSIKRENIFLTVGRLGTKQKATEILLQAFANCADQIDWNLRLVGKVEESFQSYIQEFFHGNPTLQERIEFVGVINDRATLDAEYRRAKVFVLPSRWESFGLVLPEAMANGCRILATDVVPPIKELTNYGEYGKIVPADNIQALADAMIESTKADYSEIEIQKIRNYAKAKFSWNSICSKLYTKMKECEDKT